MTQAHNFPTTHPSQPLNMQELPPSLDCLSLRVKKENDKKGRDEEGDTIILGFVNLDSTCIKVL